MSSVAGDQVSDTSTLGNHATIVNNTNGGLTTGEDADGKYIEFDGTTTATDNTRILVDYSLLGNTLTGDNDPFTFDIVFKIDENYVMGSGDVDYPYICQGGTGRMYFLVKEPGYQYGFKFGSGATTSIPVTSIPALGSIQRHTWVYDGSSINIYI